MDYSPIIKQITETLASTFGRMEPTDQTYTMVVSARINDYKYKVKYMNREATVASSIMCNIGDYVRVCVPCGNWNDAFVVCRNPTRNATTGTLPPRSMDIDGGNSKKR